ncbi:hypothetical protein F4780DRAFT_503497 [Xylariomycetidae sp. FL0641]|nr:hypothetical protein F4780DRAFT_503497 [Xylariomycetidae sp. FL0641]
MGVDSKKAPPLPAPTETESLTTPTEVVPSDVSKTDEKSHYSLPDDGTPVTIKTRGHRQNRSQTSLLIEYFEGGKPRSESPSTAGTHERRPSVRVRLTPSKARAGKNDHIQITETKSSRKASLSRKHLASPNLSRSELDVTDPEDARSMHSYASATEESNVSRNPIEVEIDSNHPRRRKKVASPLIPAADSKASSYQPPNMSDISGIPTDSFLDGSGGTTATVRDEKRARSPLRGGTAADAVANTATAGSVASEKASRKHRSESHERSVMQKAVEKASNKSERRHKSKSRASSTSERDAESRNSARRKSKGSHKESVVSGAESSVLSSQFTGSHRSYDSHSSSKVSINNPKLLETVEDAIRRLILPELESIKRERSQRETRKTSRDQASLSSLTSVSREEISTASRRRSAGTAPSVKSKDRRDREARNDISPQSSIDQLSVQDDVYDDPDDSPRRTRDLLTDAALGAAVAGAALRSRSRGDDKRQRRRRRTETSKRENGERYDEYEDSDHQVVPPMPLSSEVNASEMTRTSILSADTDRPHSASEEMTPVREVRRGAASNESVNDTPTPTRSPITLQGLGTQHANISHGDLRALPRKGPAAYRDDFEVDEFGRRYSVEPRDEYDEDLDGHLSEPGMYEDDDLADASYFGSQDVPAPLRYVPYQQERRGLSPIQSVSGYTEGESEVHGHRDSRTTHTSSEVSSPAKSPYLERAFQSPSSVPSNMRSREFGDEGSSVRSSGVSYRNTMYTDDSEVDRVQSGRAVQNVGGNAQVVHQNFGPESAVASLVDGSVIDPSVLSGSGRGGEDYRNSQISYEAGTGPTNSRGVSPMKQSIDSRQDRAGEHRHSPAPSRDRDSAGSREFSEYELNEYGQKVPSATRRQSPTTSETAITAAALSRAAAAALKRQHQGHPSPSDEVNQSQFTGDGVSRNRSFKERAQNGYQPNATPRHSVDRLSEYGQPEMGVRGIPDHSDPMPEIGYGYDDDYRSDRYTPSATQERMGGMPHESADDWPRELTPTHDASGTYDQTVTPKASKTSGNGIGLVDAAAAATIAAAGAMASSHSRQPSQEHEDEWRRTSGERKRDTLLTNPYEGASPIANLPGIDGNFGSSGYGAETYRPGFHAGSPGMAGGDEGYISSAPNDMREPGNAKGKEVVDLSQSGNDPFFGSKDTRDLGAMSQGMRTPLYDAATGTGIDRIQSKDIIALMEHLMVRDAQRSARDTEILVTLVRSAAEMRNSFEDIKRLLADTEDQIIGEVSANTESTVKKHIGGPRPFPGSVPKSLQGLGSQAGTDDIPTKKRNLLRRALQGLSAKGTNDLGRIEDMLIQLLTDVDVLKHQTAGPSASGMVATRAHSLENLQPEGQYEQDRGYEPEGNAGTSTASHASQSGHLSIPQSRAASTRFGNERKFSDHRISTVPEAEDEYDESPADVSNQYVGQQGLLSPSDERPRRGSSVPLGTPPQQSQVQHFSASNDNTPRTEESKKHKSRGSSSFFPKISRWSETTASSIGKAFRSSGGFKKQDAQEGYMRSPPSRSGSNLGDYDQYQNQEMYGDDKLHSGFSQPDLLPQAMSGALPLPGDDSVMDQQNMDTSTYATPDNPKYKAHRNSLNLQHPRPRPGQFEHFRAALENSAADYDSPLSPRSADWAGSATSLNRLAPQHTQRYSDNSAMHYSGDDYNWVAAGASSSPAAQGPPRPPKEPLDSEPAERAETPQHARVNKLQKQQPSPLPYHSVESGYGTATATHAESYQGSPRLENRNLSGALGVPSRRPSGPRAMTPSRGSDEAAREERRRKHTFGSVASPSSAVSQESETF